MADPDYTGIGTRRSTSLTRRVRSTVPFLVKNTQRAEQAAHATIDLFGRVDRVLTAATTQSLRTASMAVNDNRDVYSYTDGETLTFNPKLWKEYFENGEDETVIAAIFGLNYHELAHWMLTPSFGSPFVDQMRQSRKWKDQITPQIYNILEDQRIETQLGARYPRFRHYWRMACRHYLFGVMKAEPHFSYFLVGGRKYLPGYLRKSSRKLFAQEIGAKVADNVDRIVEEYVQINLDDTQQHVRAIELIYEFQALYEKSGPKPMTHQALGTQCKSVQTKIVDRRLIKLGKDMARANRKAQAAGDNGEIDDDDSDDEAPDDSRKVKADQVSAPSNGRQQKGGNAASGDPDYRYTRDDLIADLDRAGRDMVGTMMQTGEVMRDVSTAKKRITQSARDPRLLSDRPTQHRTAAVSAEMKNLRRQFEQRLHVLMDQADPGWEQHEPVGKLNVARVIRGDDRAYVFDAWREDRNDALSVRAILAIDLSSSMQYGRIEQVSKALWVLRRSLDYIGATTSVVGFASDAYDLMRPEAREEDDRYRVYAAYGSTCPHSALYNAKIALSNAEQRHKVLMILSDGSWDDGPRAETEIGEMNDNGITTVGFHLGDGNVRGDDYRHKNALFFNISDGMDMAKIADQLTSSLLNEALKA